MKYKHWVTQSIQNEAATLQQAGIAALPALVLAARGCHTPQEGYNALARGPELLHDPMLMAGMDQAVARIQRALRRGEQICVYGDYDVDGITATCLLTARLRAMGGNVLPYIPNRLSEGYALNNATLRELKAAGVDLIITVDCGITNIEETEFAAELGMEIVITDHHECKPDLPPAAAVVNPHQPACPYPFKQLAGVGVAMKLALALAAPEERESIFFSCAELAAIGTVADVMELTDENRAIVAIGLEQLQNTSCLGLRMLLHEAGLDGKPITATTVSYSLAPRLNAAGRMGRPGLAVDLLLTHSQEEAEAYAQELCLLNHQRQSVEMEIFQQCITLLEQRPALLEHAIILSGENWHQGVIGIVASRLVERYHLPTFMICLENGRGKGSCRSHGGFSLFWALEQCADLLETFGGHELAAGFTIPAEHLPEFRARILAIAAAAGHAPDEERSLTVDAPLPSAQLLSLPQVQALQLLEPHGAGNPQPVFLMEHARVVSCVGVGRGQHTRLQLEWDGCVFDAIFFSAPMQELGLRPGLRVDAAICPQINDFRGNRSVQLFITDLRRSLSPAQRDLQLYRRYRQGDPLASWEVLQLLPERQNFVAVWRYLARQSSPIPLAEDPAALARHISAAAGWLQPCARTLICLEVFQERGLIELDFSERQVHISLCPPRQQKVDLNASSVMLRLRRLLNGDGNPPSSQF